jgi:hypothetical protein
MLLLNEMVLLNGMVLLNEMVLLNDVKYFTNMLNEMVLNIMFMPWTIVEPRRQIRWTCSDYKNIKQVILLRMHYLLRFIY